MPGRLRYVGRYIIEDRTLGKGNFAVVELATHSITKTKVAVKVIDRCKIREDYVRDNLYREARILAQLRHPNVVRLYETISSCSLYCLVTEYAGGGDLLSFVRAQREGRLSEAVARPFVRQLVSALHHLHERGVVHRDLKMENIMLDEKRKNLKIVDFGLSNTFSADCLLKTHCGSPEYAAPELFITDQEYGPEVDIWSLGINMFAMVTGRLPFSTPYSENRRQRLMQQIRNGLGVIHAREMAHLSEECKELLSQLIEPSPELRLPLLDIEIHPWLTGMGQLPFCTYQQPPKDTEIRKMIIDKMACLLCLSAAKIEATVHEYRVDDISAIYNLMMDQHRMSKGFWDTDHTLKKEVKRPKMAEVALSPKMPSPLPQEKRDPEEEHMELRTPTVIGMVQPSQRNPNRRTCLSADFELSAVSTDARPRQNRAKTATFPQTRSKTRPIGNATTANSVIARCYHFGPPSSNEHQPKVYSCPPASPTNNSTDVHHSRTPDQPIESESRNPSGKAGPIAEYVSKHDEQCEVTQDESDQPHSEGDGPMRDCASSQQCTKMPIRKVLISGADGRLPSKDDIVSRIKTTAESAHDVKVIDMAKYFNYKHGYVIKETQLSNSSSQKGHETEDQKEDQKGSNVPVKLCGMHRDRIISETSRQEVHSCQTSRANSPANSPAKIVSQRNDLLRQQMQLPTRPVNVHFCPQHANPNQQKTMLFTKRALHSRYSQQASRTGRKTKESTAQHAVTRSGSRPNGHYCVCSLPKSDCDSPRTTLHTPVATLHPTEDAGRLGNEQAWQGDTTKTGASKGGFGRNAMPQRWNWKRIYSGKSRGWTEDEEVEDRAGVEGSGVNTMKKLQEMMSKDNVHQRVPNGNIRVKSAKMGTPRKAERCQSPQRRNAMSGVGTKRAPSSDMHKSCTAQPYKGPYILEKHSGQHQRSRTYPATSHDTDGVLDPSQQHMYRLLQQASIKFEESLKEAEKRKQQQHHNVFQAGSQSRSHHENKQIRSNPQRPETKHLQQQATEGTVALQLGQRVPVVKGSLAINSTPPPMLPNNMAPEHVFNVHASREVLPAHQGQVKSKQGPHRSINRKVNDKDWEVGYRLERKVSDTIKRAGYSISKTPDLLMNCT